MESAKPYQLPLNDTPSPLLRSRFGIAAFIIALFSPILVLAILSSFAFKAKVAHELATTTDDGGPLAFMLAALVGPAAVGLAFLAFLLFWTLSTTFAGIGLIRTRGRYPWSKIAAIILALSLASALLICRWHP